MASKIGPIQSWNRDDSIPTDAQGGYAGAASTAAALTGALDTASLAVAGVDGLQVTATTVEYGQPATATITGNLPNKIINIGIPKGMTDDAAGQILDAAQQSATAAAQSAQDAQTALEATFATVDSGTATLITDDTAGEQTQAALTTFQDQRSRSAALTDAAPGPGQWWVQRRSEDAYNLVGALPDDRYWSWTLMRDYDNPGDFRSTLTGNYSLVGVPMKFKPTYEEPGNVATTFGGQSWVQQSTLPGLAQAEPHPGLMAGAIHIDALTVTAGDRNADALSWPGGIFPQALFRKLVVHGAGEDGGDLVTEIRNVVFGSTRIVMKASPLPAVSGAFPATVYPALTQSAGDDATATATWTTPADSTRVGVCMAPAASGGIWAVTIDSSTTAATMCPTGADLLDWGYVTPADMTTSGGPIDPAGRYIDFYFSQSTPHRPVALATGLTPAAHTVTLSATGIYHRSGANCRGLITGWGYGDEDTTPATPGTDIYGQHWVIPEESAIEFAHGVSPGAGGTKTFLGSQHGWEDQPEKDLSVRVDGQPVTVDAATSVTGGSITITRHSLLHHPEMTGVVGVVTYQWELGAGRPLTARHRIEWQQAVDIAGYPVHCNVNSAEMPHAKVDTSGVDWTLTAGTDEYRGVGKNRTIAAWGDRLLWTETVPAVESATGGWNSHTGILHSIRDRAAGPGLRWGKTYMSRNGTPGPGDSWAALAEYRVALTFGDFTPPA